MNKDEEDETEKSIYDYNMIFNRINNYDEDIKFNTNIISDIDLQNLDPERYEYYTNLLYIYNKDPKTLYDLLNKYYNVKSMHQKEKGIIKYIYDYARKLKDADGDAEGDGGGGGAGAVSGGSMRRRRNRQAGGVNTWLDKFIEVLKRKMPKKAKKDKQDEANPLPSAVDENDDDDGEYYREKEGVDDLSKKIKLLEEEIEKIKEMKKESLGLTIYKDLKSRLNKKKEKKNDNTNTNSENEAEEDKEEDEKEERTTKALTSIGELARAISSQPASPITSPRTLQPSPQQSQPPTISASQVAPVDPVNTGIAALEDLANVLATGLRMSGGAGNSDDELKMKYLENNKYKDISWKELRKLKDDLKARPENIDENNKIARLSQDIDNYNFSDKGKKDNDYIIQQLNNFENDPNNPLDELAITFDDRLVFIIATFFIRYITIIIVQWCIDINIIKTFYEGFIYYAIIYIIIFWFIVLFINIDNSYDVKYMNFNGIINSIRTLFYYFYMGTNGISRLLVHTSLIIILIIIPIILNIKRKADYVDDEQIETEKILNNEERKQLSKSLSLFTMFIWLFTSIIATKF
jgi:hypothetical protein